MEGQESPIPSVQLPDSVDSAPGPGSPPGTPSLSWTTAAAPAPSASTGDSSRRSRTDAIWTARENAVVKNRQGSVLTRGLILKTDHFAGRESSVVPLGDASLRLKTPCKWPPLDFKVRRPNLGVHLQGAPNFRQAGTGGLEVYGVAQPTISGIKTILSVLQCAPASSSSSSTSHRTSDDDASSRRRVNGRQEERKGRSARGPVSAASHADRAASVTPRLGPASSVKATSSPRPDSSDVTDIEASRSLGSTPPINGLDAQVSSTKREPATGRRCVWACTRNEPVVYVGGRPFVLREAERPIDNFSLSERADNLEGIEQRLKSDILNEAGRYGGLLMVHEEDEQGGVRPAWVAVDADEVKTLREVWEGLSVAGWRCDYHRIPIAEDQPMENNYLDAYTQIIKDIDPTRTAFVANCGLGVRRTSFAMVAALLVRRRQMMLLGHPDPFPAGGRGTPNRAQGGAKGVAKSLQIASEQQSHAKALLQLVQVLGASLSNTGGSGAAIEILLSQPLLLSALKSANDGDYGVIRQLVGLLDDGADTKESVDFAIDSCAHVIHLRHSILESRVRYAVAAPQLETAATIGQARTSQVPASQHLRRALQGLEQYYFLVAFASYVNGSETAVFSHRFATWLKNRAEIWHTVTRVRTKGAQLYFFDPIADLSGLSRGSESVRSIQQRSMGAQGGGGDDNLVPGDEFADHVVRNRAGLVLRPHMLLKEDIWRSIVRRSSQALQGQNVRGAVNFRRIPGSNVFATGQPTIEGIRNILRSIETQLGRSSSSNNSKAPLQVTFINLREEPICHVNGKPYCLRQKGMSLRNIKSYSGISWARLTLLEDRLKNDVLAELDNGDGRLLLHTETDEGDVVPVWEEANASDVETLQDVMNKVSDELQQGRSHRLPITEAGEETAGDDEQVDDSERKPNVELVYRRLPITAEKPPDFSDIAGIMRAVLKTQMESTNSCIVLNCQLGRGRSTLTSVIVLLIMRWLQVNSKQDEDRASSHHDEEEEAEEEAVVPPRRQPLSYHIINGLLRVIPRGLDAKRAVDEEIDRSSAVYNLRDAIEDARLAAEDLEDEQLKRQRIQSGVHNLRRYFELIVFQAYLDATSPTTVEEVPSFESFVKKQPVFSTLSNEFDKIDIATITPLQKVGDSSSAVGMALNEEVQEVVSNRSGTILSAYTMLKSDMFPGLAKINLSQIPGIPNLRGVQPILGWSPSSSSIPPTPAAGQDQMSWSVASLAPPPIETWGHGMPSIEGLRKGLERMGAGPSSSSSASSAAAGGDESSGVVATSLREEAVCVINGRPHVLRLADQPFTNMEATGITTEAVERMEAALKADVLAEAKRYDGRLLLHDEVVNSTTGSFEIIPVWETVKDEDVLTPKEMYAMVQREGYRVQYARVAVTDEQAPIPTVFNEMEERVKLALRTQAACVWNCQMGRGRTTTGMVIASLVSTVYHWGEELLFPGSTSALSNSAASVQDLSASWSGLSLEAPANSSNGTEGRGMSEPKDALDNREDELWLQGEYRTVLQLVAILRHGKLAKRLTDMSIDRMDAVQNLRKAIYDSRLRADNADAGSKKERHLTRVYTNYLKRYGYLIVFANYLLEKMARMVEIQQQHAVAASTSEEGEDDARSVTSRGTRTNSLSREGLVRSRDDEAYFPSFISWLDTRREIRSILGKDRLE